MATAPALGAPLWDDAGEAFFIDACESVLDIFQMPLAHGRQPLPRFKADALDFLRVSPTPRESDRSRKDETVKQGSARSARARPEGFARHWTTPKRQPIKPDPHTAIRIKLISLRVKGGEIMRTDLRARP
jgi:hypothetical protein